MIRPELMTRSQAHWMKMKPKSMGLILKSWSMYTRQNLFSTVFTWIIFFCREIHPELTAKLDRLKGYFLEKSDEIALLKAWEFQELGLQAAQRVAEIQGEEALQILQFTAQNFPTQAKSLLHQQVSDDFKREMKHNIDVLGKYLNVQPPEAALFINGLYFDAESLDIGSLLETLKSELRVLEGLYKLSKLFVRARAKNIYIKNQSIAMLFRYWGIHRIRITGIGLINQKLRVCHRHSWFGHYLD